MLVTAAALVQRALLPRHSPAPRGSVDRDHSRAE
jgi:hypothetical protein